MKPRYTILKYALLLRNRTVASKVGFFLEQHAKQLMVEESHLKRLRDRRPRTPQYMERSNRKGGKLVKDWNLIVPESVLARSWEEPS